MNTYADTQYIIDLQEHFGKGCYINGRPCHSLKSWDMEKTVIKVISERRLRLFTVFKLKRNYRVSIYSTSIQAALYRSICIQSLILFASAIPECMLFIMLAAVTPFSVS